MAVCGYAVGASNPSGGININGSGNPMTQGEFLELFRAAAPLLAACIAGLVAYKFGSIQAEISKRQAATAIAAATIAQNKLKLDLFDRRMAIFQAVSETITKTLSKKSFTAEDKLMFEVKVQSAQWLFNHQLYGYLTTTLMEKLEDLHIAHDEYETFPQELTEEGQSQLEERRKKCTDELKKQLYGLDVYFSPYLKLGVVGES